MVLYTNSARGQHLGAVLRYRQLAVFQGLKRHKRIDPTGRNPVGAHVDARYGLDSGLRPQTVSQKYEVDDVE